MLNEFERNLQDAMSVARNIYNNPFILPGGGAVEMAVGKVWLPLVYYCLLIFNVMTDFEWKSQEHNRCPSVAI